MRHWPGKCTTLCYSKDIRLPMSQQFAAMFSLSVYFSLLDI
jgi:hypothetical protein